MNRAEEYEEVRRLMGRPKHQKPDADLIFAQLFRQEQLMLNKLDNTGKIWTGSTAVLSVPSVAGQAEYLLAPAAESDYGMGRPLLVYRDLGDGGIMPVPLADSAHELYNQKHDFWRIPLNTGHQPGYASEKVGFLRRDDSKTYMRIYPVPDEVRTYQVLYAAGELDWDETDLSDVPVMPEWSNVRTIEAATFLLPHAEWDGYNRQESQLHRREVATALAPQMQDYREEFNAYIRNPQHEPMGDSGYWWE